MVGTSGSGKTTLAKALAARLAYPHVELDALHWDPDWQPAPTAVFRARIATAIAADTWVVDGNYSKKARDLVWGRADTLVWLDYPLRVVLPRLVVRTLRRSLTGEVLWNGNRERLRDFVGPDSLLHFALATHRRRQKEFASALALPAFAHLTTFRLGSPAAATAWLRGVESLD